MTVTAASGGVAVAASTTIQPPPPSTIRVTRAELNGGQLRLEGSGAKPNATLTANGQAVGKADAQGSFKIQVSGFSAPTCRAVVSDGSGSTTVTLAGC